MLQHWRPDDTVDPSTADVLRSQRICHGFLFQAAEGWNDVLCWQEALTQELDRAFVTGIRNMETILLNRA